MGTTGEEKVEEGEKVFTEVGVEAGEGAEAGEAEEGGEQEVEVTKATVSVDFAVIVTMVALHRDLFSQKQFYLLSLFLASKPSCL